MESRGTLERFTRRSEVPIMNIKEREGQLTNRRWPVPAVDRHEAIRRRAEEIYVRNGKIPGQDLENWMQAEEEILRESLQTRASRKAVVVKVNGIHYVGEYDLNSSGGYTPGELVKGSAIPIRFTGNKMFVKRPNGMELETTVVKKVG
jgi:hypothetical protein